MTSHSLKKRIIPVLRGDRVPRGHDSATNPGGERALRGAFHPVPLQEKRDEKSETDLFSGHFVVHPGV